MPPDSNPAPELSMPPTGDIDLLVGIRAAQDDVTAVFRAMVDAVANPGRVLQLPVGGDCVPTVVLPALAIADLRTPFIIVGDDDSRLARALARVSGAPFVHDIPEARIVLVVDADAMDADVIWSLQVGTAHAPENGSTVIVGCRRLDVAVENQPGAILTTGPGAQDGRWFTADGVGRSTVVDLDRVNSGYPAGIDLYLVDGEGRLVALPRSNRLRYEGAA